ncbi:MAG: YlxR family protein [Acidothermus sp.]|nr:YlxR family protein [Acidothermus sp.]MCL6537602.1 YlxR family protein [Acidothermus sp.]
MPRAPAPILRTASCLPRPSPPRRPSRVRDAEGRREVEVRRSQPRAGRTVDSSVVGRPFVARSVAVPLRTCVGCRQRAAKPDLLRLVVVADGEGHAPRVVPDPRGRLPGRGAYLHRDLGCFEQALRRRALPRALRVAGPLDLTDVRAYVGATEHGRGGASTSGC